MKKVLILFVIVITTISLTGCNNKEKNDSNIKEEIEDVEDTENYEDYENNNIIYRKYILKNGDTFSILIGYDINNKEVWKYTTNMVCNMESSIYSFLGGVGNRIYLKDNKDIIVFDSTNGKQLNKIENVGNDISMIGAEGVGGHIFVAEGTNKIDNIYIINYTTSQIEKTVKIPNDLDYTGYKVVSFNNYVIMLYKLEEKDSSIEEVPVYEINLLSMLDSDWSFSKLNNED